MKKIIFLLIAAFGALSTFAQAPAVKNYATDAELSRWVLDLNLLGGGYIQQLGTASTTANYLNGVNVNTGTPAFKNGAAIGGDAQIGFFFGQKRHWGIGTGIMYMRESGNVTLDNFHAEYQSTDFNGSTFRQIVTANSISERITSDNFNIPLLLKYKARFSKHWGFTGDAGAIFNLQMKNGYKTNASFDYEAAYKYVTGGDGGLTSVYDNSPTPANSDFLITRSQFTKNNPDGNVQDYFSTKRSQGYNVGLGVTPNSKTGSVSYASGSVGFLFQPSFNYFFSDHVALNFGGYYLYQPFNNSGTGGYMLTNKAGDYNSALNSVKHTETHSYGLNVGLRFFLGKKQAPLTISSTEQSSPTECGLCNGGIALHGLPPNQPVTVDYSLNGAQASEYSTTVAPDGQVKITNLCAGNYTGIVATIKKKNAMGKAVTLTDPTLNISSENATNPTLPGVCNGSVKFAGLYAGNSVTVNYDFNGSAQAAYTGIVNSDNSITISGLCEGIYSDIVLTCNTCSTKGTDFALAAPSPPPPLPPTVVEVKADITSTVFFDFDKSIIKISYYPILDEAVKEVKENSNEYIRVDGHTCSIGSIEYNQKLSERRALAVKTYLTKKGVKSDRVKIYGHGKTQPAASNATAEGRRLNRRAIMNITPVTKEENVTTTLPK